MAPTKWGIASAGLISQDFANAILSLKDESSHQLVAVAARNLKSAQEFAKTFDIPKAYEGYESLAEDADVQVVYVGAINPTHLAIVQLMISHGKHVLCEKPLGMNVKETEQMLHLAQEKKVFLMEAIWSRFQPTYLKLKEEIDKGSIGQVLHVNADFGVQIKAERVAKKELGGGTTLDIGIYCVQLAQFVYNGETPQKVLAAGHLNPDGVDESVSVTFLYSNGKMASLQYTAQVNTGCEATIYGTEGKMSLKFPFWSATKVELKNGEIASFPLPEGKVPFNFWNSAGLGYEAQHVRECLQKGLTQSPKIPHSETLTIATLMEDIRKQVGVVYPQDD